MSNSEITIGGRRVGPGSPVYFIAEAGSNHDGNLEQAKRLIDVAADAGADAVKFQAFKAATLYPKRAGQSEYLQDPRSIYDIIRSLEMPLDWIAPLAGYCEQRGVHFLCTPFDDHSADALAPYVPAFKLASYDMTNTPLLQYVARKGKPMIVSTGTAEMDEVREMVAAVRAVGDPGLVVLQCTAKYPAPLGALNVRAVASMARLGVLAGFSDHSREPLPGPMAAVALGAVVIEKHFTLSNKLSGPDHVYALEPHELKDLIGKVRQVEKVLGSGEKTVHAEEQELRAFARRSIFTSRALAEGEHLRRSDLAILRCGTLPYGVHPKEYLRLFGRQARHPLAEETAVRFEDLGGLCLQDGDLSLRLIEARDAASIVVWRGLTVESSERWFDVAALRADGLAFVVEQSPSGPLGTIGISNVDFVANRADFSVALATNARDLRLAHRACALLLDHAFETLGLQEVSLCSSDDAWIRSLSDSLGFTTVAAEPEGQIIVPASGASLTAERWRHLRSRR
jgi:N,N'-diacetyllegionaminate synthase